MAAIIVISPNDQISVNLGGQGPAKIMRKVEASSLESETLWNWQKFRSTSFEP